MDSIKRAVQGASETAEQLAGKAKETLTSVERKVSLNDHNIIPQAN